MRIFKLLLAGGAIASTAAAAPTITNVTTGPIFSPRSRRRPGSRSSAQTSPRPPHRGAISPAAPPTSLGGVKVSINGLPAYVAFISSGQINALVPDDPTVGKVPVVVTNAQGTSNAYMANKQAIAPALFAYSQQGGAYAVVQAALTYQAVAPTGLLGTSVNTVLAAQNENVILWATGLGPTTPPQPTGQLVSAPAPVAAPVQITVAGQTVTPQFVGLVDRAFIRSICRSRRSRMAPLRSRLQSTALTRLPLWFRLRARIRRSVDRHSRN